MRPLSAMDDIRASAEKIDLGKLRLDVGPFLQARKPNDPATDSVAPHVCNRGATKWTRRAHHEKSKKAAVSGAAPRE
jgi:hypothetical protein